MNAAPSGAGRPLGEADGKELHDSPSRTIIAVAVCGSAAFLFALIANFLGSGIVGEALAAVAFSGHPIVVDSLQRNKISFSSKLYAPWLAALSGLTHLEKSLTLAHLLLPDRANHPQPQDPPWYVDVVTTSVLFAIFNLLTIAPALTFQHGLREATGILVVLSLLIQVIYGFLAFRVGCWIGACRYRYQYRVALAAMASAQVVGTLFVLLFGGIPLVAIAPVVVLDTMIWFIPTAFGVRRGKTRRAALTSSSILEPAVIFWQTPVLVTGGSETDHWPRRELSDSSSVVKQCHSCGTAAWPRARFCLRCGTRIAESPPTK